MLELADISMFKGLQEANEGTFGQPFDDPVGYGELWQRDRASIRIPYVVRRMLGLSGSEHNVEGDIPASVVAAYKKLNQGKYKNAVKKYNDAYTDYRAQSDKYKHIYANEKLKNNTTPEMDSLRDDIVDCDYSSLYFQDVLDHNKPLLEFC